jgi:FkbH-like protein
MSEALALRLAATFTLEPIEPALRLWAELLDLDLSLTFAPFGQLYQALLADGGAREITGLFVRLEDLAAGDLAAAARELGETLRDRADRAPAARVLLICPASAGASDDARRALSAAEAELAARLVGAPGLSIVRSDELLGALHGAPFDDAHREAIAAVPYRPALFAALATALVRRALAATRRPRKVLVLDADETLWSGVLGEDGAAGLTLGPGRRALHARALALREAGLLLALASKNDERDLGAAFAARPDFPLRFEHFSARRVGWGPKVEGLAAIARELDLGLDSLVFLDDSPLEIALVRAQLPEVVALQLPRDDDAVAAFVAQIWALDLPAATDADRGRAQAYEQEQARRGARAHATSLADFLAGLALQVNIEALTPGEVPRAAQLTQRTNQLNTTLRRRSEAEVARLADEGLEAAVVQARDRFGDYGVVGLFVCAARGEALVVETFLLSCRALGRGIEEQMLAEIGRRALASGKAQVELPFVRGPRNQPARALLERVAGAPMAQHPDGATFSLAAARAAGLVYVAVEEPRPPTVSAALVAPPSPGDARSALWQRVAEELHDARALVAEIELRQRRAAGDRAVGGAPTGAVEQLVAAIFGSTLGLDRVGADEGFFDLGGHSLAMTEVLSRLRDSFLVELPLAAMLTAPTVRGVARAVEEAAGAEAAHALAELVARVNALSDDEVEALLGDGDPGALPADAPARIQLGSAVSRISSALDGAALRAPISGAALDARLAAIFAPRAGAPRSTVGRIETIAIPTCDRPETLARCVESHLADARRHGRLPTVVVADDSRSPELASRTRESLRAFPGVRYADHARKRAFAAALSRRAGVDPALLDFALFDPEGAGHPTGANLNALLLDGAGELVFRADDDTLGGAAPTPQRRSGLALSSGRDPAELWIFPDRAACFATLDHGEPLDLLAQHASLLGRDPRSIALDHAGELAPGALAEPFLRRLAAADARVRVSFTGLAGDCGWGAPFGFWGVPLGYLLLEGEGLRRLTRDAASYRAQCTSRELIRATTRAAIGDATFGMTTFVGLDLRGLVPPYLPVRRGQDLLWVQTLEACFDDALFGQIPAVLRHEPGEPRRFTPGELFRSATGLDLARIFVALLRSADLAALPGGAPRLLALGLHLARVGSLSPDDFDALLRDALLGEQARLAAWAGRVLAENPGAPTFWRSDVERYVDEAGRFLLGAPRLVPLDLVTGTRSLADAADLTRRLVRRFGELCQVWPAIHEAALALKAQGTRVAQPLTPAGHALGEAP